MAHDLKPIETHYHGYRFRSRLEARWAVFLDTVGISWTYEAQGYELGPAGSYLPDFELAWPEPDRELFVEIKHAGLAVPELAMALGKATELAMRSHQDVLVITGQPWAGSYWCWWAENGTSKFSLLAPEALFGLTTEVRQRGFDAARSARFEWGETPTPPAAPQPGKGSDRLRSLRPPPGYDHLLAPEPVTHRARAPIVYFAGGIAKGDWRHGVCPPLRDFAVAYIGCSHDSGSPSGHQSGHCCCGEAIVTEYGGDSPVNLPTALDGFAIYGGPFFIGDDHGCYHREHGHGIRNNGGADGTPSNMRSGRIVQACSEWIRTSDAMFVWLDRDDAYGTIAEIGFAAALGKPVFLYEPMEANERLNPGRQRDMWFVRQLAHQVLTVFDVDDALTRFPADLCAFMPEFADE